MQKVVVYSQPGCGPCRKVKQWFDNKGVEYSEIDVTQDSAALEHIRSLGHMGVPVVETAEKNWVGINLPNMKELVNA